MDNYVIGRGVRLVYLKGAINAQSESVFSESYRQALADGTHTIIYNFSGVTSLNLFGINILVRLYLESRRHGIALVAAGLSPRYLQIFQHIGLDEAVTVFDDEMEAFVQVGIPEDEMLYWNDRVYLANLYAPPGDGRILDGAEWADLDNTAPEPHYMPSILRHGFRRDNISGPLQGFGQLWEKTYLIPFGKSRLQPEEIIATLKERFAEFSAPDNRVVLAEAGIVPGAAIAIDMSYRYGRLLTSVLVLHCDESSFTLVTPRGHPKSGWVTFGAYRDGGNIFMQAQGLSRSSDPLFAMFFHPRISGRNEYTWRRIVEGLAGYYNIDAAVSVQRTCWDSRCRWAGIPNMRYNAQLRSLPYNVKGLCRRS